MTVYGNDMSEIQMMNLVLDNIKESHLYIRQSTGSHIPGHGCGDGMSNCNYATGQINIQRMLGLF